MSEESHTPGPEVSSSQGSFLKRGRRRLGAAASLWLEKGRYSGEAQPEPDPEAIAARIQGIQAELRMHDAVIFEDPFVVTPRVLEGRLRVSSLATGRSVNFSALEEIYGNERHVWLNKLREQRIAQLTAEGHSLREASRILSQEFPNRRMDAATVAYRGKHMKHQEKIEDLQWNYDVRLPMGKDRIPIYGQEPLEGLFAEHFEAEYHKVPTTEILERIQQWQTAATAALEFDQAPSADEIDLGLAVYGAILEIKGSSGVLRQTLYDSYEGMVRMDEAARELWQIDHHDPVRGFELREAILADFALIVRTIQLEKEAAQPLPQIDQ